MIPETTTSFWRPSSGLQGRCAPGGLTWLVLVGDGQRVIGAEILRDGQPMTIAARRGVLLATGGFSRNAELRRRYQGGLVGADWTASAPGATGDGIQMGQAIGAAIDRLGAGGSTNGGEGIRLAYRVGAEL